MSREVCVHNVLIEDDGTHNCIECSNLLKPSYQQLLSQIAVQRAALEKIGSGKTDQEFIDETSHLSEAAYFEAIVNWKERIAKDALSQSPSEALEVVRGMMEALENTKTDFCNCGEGGEVHTCLMHLEIDKALTKAKGLFGV